MTIQGNTEQATGFPPMVASSSLKGDPQDYKAKYVLHKAL